MGIVVCVATGVRDWATVDYYALLGVDADASGDDIARAFRAAAKQSHPDATGDPVAAEHFKELAAAYTVLSNGRMRRDYDRVRAVPKIDAPRPRTVTALPRTRWTRKRAWFAVVGGIVCTIFGVGMLYLTVHLHDRDASRRAHFVPVTAQRIDDTNISFTTRTGVRVTTREPEQFGEGNAPGTTVGVRYDPANPHHVIVDASTLGRDITLAIVAIKLLIGGPVFLILGARYLRRTTGVR